MEVIYYFFSIFSYFYSWGEGSKYTGGGGGVPGPEGGGLYISSSDLTIAHNIIAENSVGLNGLGGGGIPSPISSQMTFPQSNLPLVHHGLQKSAPKKSKIASNA